MFDDPIVENEQTSMRRVKLVEVLDRLLNRGVYLEGDLTLAVANIDLIYVGLRVLVSSIETAQRIASRSGSGARE